MVALLAAIKAALVWLVKYVAGRQVVLLLVKQGILILFILAMGVVGLLPESPLKWLILPIYGYINQIPYYYYISYFIPTVPILTVMIAWIPAIWAFHKIKIYLRNGKIIS